MLRKLAVPGGRANGLNKIVQYRPQELSKRLGQELVADLVRRAEAGESIRSLALELCVSNSALTRMLRDQGVTIRKAKVSDGDTKKLAREYATGATMRELEARHGLSHGVVLRALHRAGVEMRAKAPRPIGR